jgi:ssDNA-binding Zn-finger/Zn-ribbon topoisomerase 1
MKCPNCAIDMTSMTLEGHLTAPINIDVCTACQAFWFDKYESLKLAPGSTLKLIKLIGEQSSKAKPPLSKNLRCPRCSAILRMTHDMQRNTKFAYWRCDSEHGRFIGFFDFLKEKNFIRPLSTQQIEELRKNVQTVNCSNCGAAIDLATTSVCAHCGSPLSMLDGTQTQTMLAQLQKAAEPHPIDPTLPIELARVKTHMDVLFGPSDNEPDWWSNASASGLVEAGLGALSRWLTKSGI